VHFLIQLVRWEIWIFLLGLAAIIVLQLLTGKINTQYLLYGTITGKKENDGRYFSPERVQLLVFTIGGAFYYVSQVMASAQSGKFPEIPESLVLAMGGSNVIYLGGKAYTRWLGNDGSK